MSSQRNPFVLGTAQARIGGRKISHLADVDRFAHPVRAAQADQDVVPGLADREAILEIELPGFLPAQRYRGERPEIVGVVVVDRRRHGPAGRIVARKKIDVVQHHRRLFDLRRPAAGRWVDRDHQVPGVDSNRHGRMDRLEWKERQRGE